MAANSQVKKKKITNAEANVRCEHKMKRCKTIDGDGNGDDDDYDVTNGSRLRPIEIYFILLFIA